MSAARDFQRVLGAEVAKALGGDVEYVPSRLLLRWCSKDADNLVQLSGSNKWSPFVSVAYYFGRRFDAASKFGNALAWGKDSWHISQYSVNLRLMKDMPYTGPAGWEVDIRNPPSDLARQIADSIHGVAYPFFDRFSSMLDARDALASGDSWCIPADVFWSGLLLLDAALDDVQHYEKWSSGLSEFYRVQSDAMLAEVKQLVADKPNNAFNGRRAKRARR